MAVGRSHKWYYEKGVWKDKKLTPDLWEIDYEVVKRRAGKAPKNSGAPVGTEYHGYILAHQFVRKLNANNYTTRLTGLKYKLAHKRFDKATWSASERAQRNRIVKLLQKMIADLEKEPEEQTRSGNDSQRVPAKNVTSKSKKKSTKKELEEA